MTIVSDVVEMTSDESNFDAPVTAKLTYERERVTNHQNLRVSYWNESIEVWVPIDINSTRIDPETGTIEVDIMHFTKFVLMEIKDPVNFSDVSNQWFASYVDRMAIMRVTTGYVEDGVSSFKPQKSISRAEFAVFLARVLNLKKADKELTFEDKAAIPEWAKDSVAAAVEKGIIAGYDDQTFRPDSEITRSEMIVMIIRAMGLEGSDKALNFKDTDTIPQWAAVQVAKAVELGIIGGRPDNTVDPLGSATRGETAKIIIEMVELIR